MRLRCPLNSSYMYTCRYLYWQCDFIYSFHSSLKIKTQTAYITELQVILCHVKFKIKRQVNVYTTPPYTIMQDQVNGYITRFCTQCDKISSLLCCIYKSILIWILRPHSDLGSKFLMLLPFQQSTDLICSENLLSEVFW